MLPNRLQDFNSYHWTKQFLIHMQLKKKVGGNQTAKIIPWGSQLQHLGMRQAAFHYHSQVHVRR